MAELTPLQRRWFLAQRGITEDTLDRWGVYSEGDDTLIFPWPHNEKIRQGTLSGDRKMRWRNVAPDRALYGTDQAPKDTRSVFIVEGETDTMRLDQALRLAGKDTAAVFGLSGMNWWLPQFAKDVANADRCYVIFDNDDPYANATAVEAANKAWLEMRQAIGPKASRVFLPQGVKDVCEFFAAYDIEGTNAGIQALETLCRGATKGRLNLTYTDLSAEPPDYDFLVEDWIAMGDLVLMFGEPGAGKSWSAMALAVAVANGDPAWLGKPVNHSGRVLYVDQENPLDVMLNRFYQLGLTAEGRENLSTAWMQNIRVDMNGDQLLEDALTIAPTLIIVDSLSKIHSKKENDSGEMSGVFRDYLIPLARSTGAATCVLHHVVKSGDASGGFSRIRGSSSIPADVDFGIDFRPTGTRNEFKAIPYKPRRGQGATTITAIIEDYGVQPNGKPMTRVEPVLAPASVI